MLSSAGSRPPSVLQLGTSHSIDGTRAPSALHSTISPLPPTDDLSALNGDGLNLHQEPMMNGIGADKMGGDDPHALPDITESTRTDQDGDSREVNTEEESFALAPIDASALKGVTKTKRKRKLIVDEVKNISGEEMKSQLANTSDIVTTLDLAPPTKRLMYWKETGGVEKLFALPSRDIPARDLSKVRNRSYSIYFVVIFFTQRLFSFFQNYQRNLVSRSTAVEDFSMLGPADVLALDQYQDQPPQQVQTQEIAQTGKRGRKRKNAQPDVNINITGEAGVIRGEDDASQSLDLLQQQLPNDSLMPPPATPALSTTSHPQLEQTGSAPMEGDIPLAFTPSNLEPAGMTPLNLGHGGMTPVGLHGDYPPFTPLDHGMIMTPHHGIEQIESIPNLPVDQVSSILNGTGLDGFTNMGYDDGNHMAGTSAGMSERIANDWTEDYDFPPSVGAHVNTPFFSCCILFIEFAF